MSEINSVFAVENPVLRPLHQEADQIQAFLNLPANLQDPASLTYRLKDLDVYLARLSEMMIRAKALKEMAQNRYVTENGEELNKLSATVSNRQINAFLYEYKITYERLDAMCHLCEHLSRDLVTQISYIKQQMALV